MGKYLRQNNRSLRKKYLDLIAAAKTTAAKDPSISSLVAPVDLFGQALRQVLSCFKGKY